MLFKFSSTSLIKLVSIMYSPTCIKRSPMGQRKMAL